MLPGGAAAGAGLRVYIWPADGPVVLEEREPAEADGRGARSTLTDAGGHFRIDGLAPELRWRRLALAPGLYSPDHAAHAPLPTGTLDAVVPVARLFGAAIALRDEDGGPLGTCPELKGRGPGPVPPQGGAILLPALSPGLALAAPVPPDAQAAQRDTQWMILAQQQPGTPSALVVQGEVAGYEPLRHELMPRPVQDGLPVTELRLKRRCAGFTSLTLRVVGTGPALEATQLPEQGYRRLECELRRADEPPARYGFTLPLRTLPWEPVRFDGIPQGRWLVRLRSWHGQLSVPPEDEAALVLDLGPEPAALTFQVPDLGAVQLLPQRADGSAWSGRAQFRLEVDGATGTLPVLGFESAPYVIEGLTPGRYRIALTSPFDAGPAGSGGAVVVEAGALLRVALHPRR